jgi:hypothetical protein
MKNVTWTDKVNPAWAKINASNYQLGSFILLKIRKCYQANLFLLRVREKSL